MKVLFKSGKQEISGELFTVDGRAIFKCIGKTLMIVNPEFNIYCEEDDNCIMIFGFEQDEVNKDVYKKVIHSFYPVAKL